MDERVLQLSDAFTAAAVNPDLWMPALRMLASATGSSHGQLIGIGSDTTIPFNWANDLSQPAHEEFIAIGGGSPRINSRIAASLGAPMLAVRSEAANHRAIATLESDIYLDYCQDFDIPYGCQCKLFEGESGFVGLALLRSERDGKTTIEQRALFAAVAPFVRSAVLTQITLERDGPTLITGALDSVSAAVFICAPDGQVLSHTAAAADLLASGRIGMAGGMLKVTGQAIQDRLLKAIARHAAALPVPLESLLLPCEPQHGPPLILDVATMPRGPWSINLKPKALVIVRGDKQWHTASVTILQSVYGLSPAEVDVAMRLARGQPRESIAEERNARFETIRSQIKSVFAKLGITREVELVAMLGQLLRR